jgi:hypothetical protein
MTPELEAIKDELTTRNVIAFVTEQRHDVNSVRTGHHEHVVFATVNGRVIQGSEKVFVGMESSPRVKEIFRLQALYGIGDKE